MRPIFIFLMILFVALGFSGNTFAKGIFTITNIQVSGQGKNAKWAKKDALSSGEEKAYLQLLERITPSSTQPLWPELTSEDISELVQGFEIKEEKITPRHYKAILDISFNQMFVEKLLQEAGVVYISKSTDPIILIPLLNSNGKKLLWESNNQWRKAWYKALESSSFAQFIIPNENNGDASYVNIARISQDRYPLEYEEKELLNALRAKYKAKEILLAQAYHNSGTQVIDVLITNLNEDYPEKTTRRFYAENADDPIEDVMKNAASDIISRLEERWKKNQEYSQMSKSMVNVTVPISDFIEWTQLYKQLSSFHFIQKINTKYITVKYASLDLHFQDGYDNLVDLLAAQKLYLETKGDELFLVKYENPPLWFKQEYNEIDYEF